MGLNRFYYQRHRASARIDILDRRSPRGVDEIAYCYDTDIAETIVAALNERDRADQAVKKAKRICTGPLKLEFGA